jgi:hypothetical protein
MLIPITNIQVPTFWEVIKFAALESDGVEEKYHGSYCVNLLYDLLSKKKLCYIAKKDSKISLVFIIYFYKDSITDKVEMAIKNLYTFAPMTKADLEEIKSDMYKIARKAKCRTITGETGNKKLHDLLSIVGVDATRWKYIYFT